MTTDAYGSLIEPATLKIQRLLPGPIDRVWAYLTQSDLRKQWLAAGEMSLKVGEPVEFVWRNDELSDPPGERPAGFPAEHRLKSELTEVEAPYRLAFTWGSTGGVTFELEAHGKDVLLTVIHRRLPDRGLKLNVSAGWHAHLDTLVTVIKGERAASPFWDTWVALKSDYESRIPA
ncbi:MAG: SRPBCC family protein [Steroidobacteraceae bacterium]